MCADDLILLSISIRELQKLVNICNVKLNDCFLDVNNMKSAYIRIGPRFKILSCNFTMNGVKLVWKNEIRYLGIFIISGYKFKINMQQKTKILLGGKQYIEKNCIKQKSRCYPLIVKFFLFAVTF